jgi:endo-1,3(4)-beta-glucanase
MGNSHSEPEPPSLRRSNSVWLDSITSSRTRKGVLDRTSASSAATEIPPDNIFVPIQEDDILSQVPISWHHPVPRKGIEDDNLRTLNTNKFYANTFLGEQNKPVWTHPYSVWWGKGWKEPGTFKTWGICISHIEESDLAYGGGDPTNVRSPQLISEAYIDVTQVYTNPLLKQSLILSSKELGPQTVLTTDTHLPFSININLSNPRIGPQSLVTFPVVQGMTFVTAGYKAAMPTIQTGGKGFVDFKGPINIGKSTKYRVKDMDGRDWLIYINPGANITYDPTHLFRMDSNTIIGPPNFKGTIQVAKNPLGADGEILYDRACGAFVTEAKLTAVVNDTKGTYTFNYTKVGTSPLLMFVLPHHIQSLNPELLSAVTRLQLRTTTKGMARAIWAEKLSLTESNLPTSMSFGPWSPYMSSTTRIRYPPSVLALIAAVAERDLRRAMTEPIPKEPMYHAGKTLAKFATIVWVCKDVLMNDDLATAGLDKLKVEMARWVENQQLHPIYYDDDWKGIVSNAGFTDPNADFGNTYYSDHHIHFGYFVYTSAVIAGFDPSWLTQGDNKSWTNMLVKDYNESDYNGRDYPFQRSFDWWHGHSWAKGLFGSAAGKDQQSTSEDGFASFAIKMWGKVTGDAMMEKRGTTALTHARGRMAEIIRST